MNSGVKRRSVAGLRVISRYLGSRRLGTAVALADEPKMPITDTSIRSWIAGVHDLRIFRVPGM